MKPQSADQELADRELARRSLLDWAEYVAPYTERPEHVELIADALTRVEAGTLKRLIVMCPPRHGKSDLCSVHFPSWYLGRNPDHRFLLATYGAELSAGFSRRARNDLEESGHVFDVEIAGDSSAANRWDISGHAGGMFSVGVGGGTTGRGANVLGIDDPVKDAQEADSDLYRERVWEWYTQVARTRLEPDGAIVVVMTRWHDDDLVGRLLAAMETGGEQWEVICLPAIAEEGDRLGREIGQALWPERYDVEDLLEIESAIGPRAWEALYQQRPAPATGEVFKAAWWQHRARKDWPERFGRIIQSWDCAFKDERAARGRTDFVVGQVWGVCRTDRYLLDQVRGRWDFPATCEAVISLCEKWPDAQEKLVEDKANGPAVIATLRDTISGIVPVNPRGGKVARAHAVTHLLAAGNVWLPDPQEAPWIEGLKAECQSFPRGKHDDQVDAMTQALAYLQPIAPRQKRGDRDRVKSTIADILSRRSTL